MELISQELISFAGLRMLITDNRVILHFIQLLAFKVLHVRNVKFSGGQILCICV